MRNLLLQGSVLLSAALVHRKYYPKSYLHCDSPPKSKTMIPPFQTTFAVPMHCNSCVEDVSSAVHRLDGITALTPSLPTQTLTITGTAAPSAIISAIQSTGRDAILRGSGASNSAAVSILETPTTHTPSPVRGLARLVQVAPGHTLIDLTVRGLPPGIYSASIRSTGDISRGAASVGGVWRGSSPSPPHPSSSGTEPAKGLLGEVIVDETGAGGFFVAKEVSVWEVVGRGLVVERDGGEAVVGVIARSAGVWENEKVVCSCSGKTVWEERGEQVARGML